MDTSDVDDPPPATCPCYMQMRTERAIVRQAKLDNLLDHRGIETSQAGIMFMRAGYDFHRGTPNKQSPEFEFTVGSYPHLAPETAGGRDSDGLEIIKEQG